jgi:hypothetical protein
MSSCLFICGDIHLFYYAGMVLLSKSTMAEKAEGTSHFFIVTRFCHTQKTLIHFSASSPLSFFSL